MKKIILIIILIVLVFYLGFKVKWSKLFSHGVLSEAHQKLEKSGKCNACHTKGQKLDIDKCLLCHEEIQDKIKANSGLHARVPRECANCHSEHHGESYSLIHLDIETFDHDSTGWPLNGKHALLRCTVCHDKESYLLDKNKCNECHEDPHDGEYGLECSECHNQITFEKE